jgi:hypothetical protein
VSAAAVHAPKVSHHDLRENTHRVNKGTFAVDLYELGGGWLYRARPHIASMEAYLLPRVDVMAFEVGEDARTARNLYLDVVTTGRAAQIADTDEYLAVLGAGLTTAGEAGCVLTRTDAPLAKYGLAWGAQGVSLTWRR